MEDNLSAIMANAYKEHRIPQWYVFKPYFEWVDNNRHSRIRPCHIREMRNVALSLLKMYDDRHPNAFDKMGTTNERDPFFPFDAYDEDKVVVRILNQIIEELSNLLILITD